MVRRYGCNEMTSGHGGIVRNACSQERNPRTRLGDHDYLRSYTRHRPNHSGAVTLLLQLQNQPNCPPHAGLPKPLHETERCHAHSTTMQHLRRQDDGVDRCQSGAAYDPAAYNLGLHIGSVFVVLAVSSLACAFPLLVLRFPRLRIPARVLFVVRHFGTGVLLATAFVHLLPTAFISLGDPCLSPFWTNDYPAMPGAIALFAIFIIAGIEMTFSPEKRCCAAPMEASGVTTPSSSHRLRTAVDEDCCVGVTGQNGVSPAVARPVLASQETHDHDRDHDHTDVEAGPDEKIPLTTEQEHRKAFLQCVLLEMGILFHSVFIGMNLSVSSGREFVILFIAIVFHRKCIARRKRRSAQSVEFD